MLRSALEICIILVNKLKKKIQENSEHYNNRVAQV